MTEINEGCSILVGGSHELPPQTGKLNMKIVGARETVSGSCTWLYHPSSDTQFLVDCGLHQGADAGADQNRHAFPFDPAKIKYVLLTHAHLDHCGLIPRLVKEGFTGKVFATEATRDLAVEMLKDAVRISNLYTEDHVKSIIWNPIDPDKALGFKWGRLVPLADDLRVGFLRNSHILGASTINITWKSDNPINGPWRTICFSGDIGCQTPDNQYLPVLKHGYQPYPKTDYIVTEATYGDRTRDTCFMDADARARRLAEIILHTVFVKQGKVVIPAFSLQRTQELIFDLWHFLRSTIHEAKMRTHFHSQKYKYKNNPITVSIDSPLGREVTRIFANFLFSRLPNGKHKYLNPELPERLGLKEDEIRRGLETLLFENSLEVEGGHCIGFAPPDNSETNVILASSGMCDHGPAAGHLKELGNDPRNTIILTGHQSPGTRGHELMKRAQPVCYAPVHRDDKKAEVIDMSGYYSAHADKNALLDFIFGPGEVVFGDTPARVFVNHGNRNARFELVAAIRERAKVQRGGERTVAEVMDFDARWFDLEVGEYMTSDDTLLEMKAKIEMLEQELEAARAR